MTRLVIGCGTLFVIGEHHALPFGTHQDFVFRHLEVNEFDFFLIQTRCPQPLRLPGSQGRHPKNRACRAIFSSSTSASGTFLGMDFRDFWQATT